MKRNLPIIIIAAVLLAALAGGAFLMRSSGSSTTPANNAQTATASQVNNMFNGRTAASDTPPVVHVRGRADAPLLIEEYGDFQCPPCGLFHPVLKRIEHEYETRLRVVFHHFPLRTMHKNAAEAARAAEAAGQQGKFWEMHDMLFEKQAEWKDAAPPRPIFINYARALDIDPARFAADMESTLVSNRLLSDEREGAARGVTGTPTVFLNGREVPYLEATDYNKLRAILDRELAAKK